MISEEVKQVINRKFLQKKNIYSVYRTSVIVLSLVLAVCNTVPLSAFDDVFSDSEIQFIDPNACNPNQGAEDTTQSGGSVTGNGKWSIQQGTPVNITDEFRSFMNKVAEHTSFEPIITTSTNGRHTAGSDHYSGNAGDFGSVLNNFGTNNAVAGQDVPRGDNLAAAALIAAGVDEAQAISKAKQGLTPGTDDVTATIDGAAYRVQVIWKTSGHFDHVHIGIKKATTASNGLDSVFDSIAGFFGGEKVQAATAADSEGMTGKTDVEKVYNRLIELGLPAKATAGMVGNLVFETGAGLGYKTSEDLNPRATNNISGGHTGIVQWSNGDRWVSMKKFAQDKGKDHPYYLNIQTEYIWDELQRDASGYPVLDLIKSAEPAEAARIINEKYEITGMQEGRAQAATYFYGKYQEGGGVSAISDEPVAGCCPTDGGGAITSLAPGSGSPTGVTFPNLNPESMAAGIDKYIKQTNANSRLKDTGAKIVASSEASNINPFLIVAIAQMESGLASPGDYNVRNANNSYGRTATASQPNHYSASVSRRWYKWTSVPNSVDHTAPENSGDSGDIAEYIRNSGAYDTGLASGDLYDIMSVYAPPSENDTQQYVNNVKSWMKRMASASAGGAVSGSEDVETTSDTPLVGCSCADPTAQSTSNTPSGDASDTNTWRKIYQTNPSISQSMNKGSLSSPKAIIIHFTVGDAEGPALLNSMIGSGVGVQFNVGKTGTVYQTFPLDDMKVAYHVKQNNSRAIGIEITGKDGKDIIENDEQFESVVGLTRKLIEKYNIPADDPIGLITDSDDPTKTQGLLGHGETARNGSDRTDPDSYVKNNRTYRLTDNQPWVTPQDNKDSAKHAYMIKLRQSLGLKPTPGSEAAPGTSTTALAADTSDCSPGSSEALTTNDLEENKSKFSALLDLPPGAKGVPKIGFFDQCDPRWATKDYPYVSGGRNTICASACGPSSMAMIISTIGTTFVSPEEIAKKAKPYHVSGGTSMSKAAPNILPQYGLKAENLGSGSESKAKIISTIESGGLVIYNAGAASPFTNAGHFIIIRAVSDDGSKFWVGDPNNHNQGTGGKNGVSYKFSDLYQSGWVNSDGFWGVTKK